MKECSLTMRQPPRSLDAAGSDLCSLASRVTPPRELLARPGVDERTLHADAIHLAARIHKLPRSARDYAQSRTYGLPGASGPAQLPCGQALSVSLTCSGPPQALACTSLLCRVCERPPCRRGPTY
jgi:hypothetical protein